MWINYSYTGSDPTVNITVELQATASSNSIVTETSPLTITFGSIVQEIIGENTDNETLEDYNIGASTTTYTTGTGSNTETHEAVSIVNMDNTSGGVADPDGRVEITVNVPVTKEFILVLNGGNGGRIYIEITLDGVTYKTGSNGVKEGNNYISAYTSSGHHNIASQTTLNSIVNNYGWMQSNSGTATIVVKNINGGNAISPECKMDIVFK